MNQLRTILSILGLSSASFLWAQKPSTLINAKEAERIERVLASDEMRGRKVYTPDIDRAASFIESEFTSIGLKPFGKETGFFQEFSMQPKNDSAANESKLRNIVGVLPGRSRKDELVIFSGHYDHIGIGEAVNADSIYNGANDDAAGITAVIMLARYFKKLDNNERTLVFVAFTAEEVGGFGSRYFSEQLDPERVVAMINIEMIGTRSKWGKNSAYITGYYKTDMGKILQKDLKGTGFTFHPDPYREQKLFFRSDNATLALLGVPAHTISTSKMDNEPNYHMPSDQVETLDLKNMAMIIRSIALSAKSIIAGKATPSRLTKADLESP